PSGRAYPRTVVLETAVDDVWTVHVIAHVVKLPDRQISEKTPVSTAVFSCAEAAVVADDELFRIIRIDPHGVEVTVDAAGDEVECLAAVFALNECSAWFVHSILVLRIDVKVRK